MMDPLVNLILGTIYPWAGWGSNSLMGSTHLFIGTTQQSLCDDGRQRVLYLDYRQGLETQYGTGMNNNHHIQGISYLWAHLFVCLMLDQTICCANINQ